jgi:alpha-1,3-rhamnosyltransferase
VNTNPTPLVSIIVITYFSAEYVLETLDSIYAQSYPNIELIIADDASTDQTSTLCENWLAANGHRFVNAKLVKADKNTGTAANCNRGIKQATGQWIKIIAGDDCLEHDIIAQYITFLANNPEAKCMYANVNIYDNIFEPQYLQPQRNLRDLRINQPDCAAAEQFQLLLRSNPVWASTIMTRKDVLEQIGLFNEKYMLFEDRPMLLELTRAGHQIHYLDIAGAKYRRHSDSVQTVKSNVFISRLKQNQEDFFRHEYLHHYKPYEQWAIKYRYQKNAFLKKTFNNKSNLWIRGMSHLLDLLPKFYLRIKQ